MERSQGGVLPSAKIETIATWAGCKMKMAHHIIALCGEHRAWWDLFGGGLSVTLAKPPSRIEVVNDLHGDITNLARVIADAVMGPRLYRRLRRVLFDQTLHREAQERLESETDSFTRAYLYFLKSWMGYGGLVGSRRMMYRHNIGMPYSTTGGLKIKRFHAAIDSIPAWRRRLRNVTILNEDVFRILPRIEDDTGTVIYADPPYVTNRIQYEHEFALEDHARLSHALHRFRRARILVSYESHPLIAELYDGWSRRSVLRRRVLSKKSDAACHPTAVEWILCNQEILA